MANNKYLHIKIGKIVKFLSLGIASDYYYNFMACFVNMVLCIVHIHLICI